MVGGKSLKPGKFHNADECVSYCNDGSWPVKKTCSSGSCNEKCAQCVEGDSWRFPDGAACYLTKGSVNQNECWSLDGYDWDWQTQLCYRKSFSGNEADCIAFDQSSGHDVEGLSLSMVFVDPDDFSTYEFETFPQASLTLSHEFVSCSAQETQNTCGVYCWAKDYDDYSPCMEHGLEWDWELARCKYSIWTVNAKSSPTCESYVSGLDENSSEHDRWKYGENCWTNGCHFDPGQVGFSSPTCQGQARGCDQQAGNTEWVDGGDASSSVGKILLGCRWDKWRSCSTEETCLKAGECEDWFISESGKCIVPIEPNEWGHRKSCYEIKNPIDGTRFEWADKMGCVARKTIDGTETIVKEEECASVGGSWEVRAKTKEECEDDRGQICTHPFDEWRIFGGIQSEEKCNTCGYESTHPTTWRSGIWSTSGDETPLHWLERSFSTKNTWENRSFDSEAFHGFIRNSISRYVADAYKSKVYCELGAYNAFIPAIISMCKADGEDTQNIVQYELTSSQVSCGDLRSQPPIETYEGSISYTNARCTGKDDTFAEITMGKVVTLTQEELVRRRRMESSSVCAVHEVIKNDNHHVVGQKIGSGLSVTNIDNVTLCIKPSVPDDEICSEYVDFDIATVDSTGLYSLPLAVNTTINQQGEICFSGAHSGVTYVPVKLVSGWQAIGNSTTNSPTSTGKPTASLVPTISADSSSVLPPTRKPSPKPTGSPTSASTTVWHASFMIALPLFTSVFFWGESSQ